MTEMETRRYIVPAMHCEKCEQAVRGEMGKVVGVDAVDVDLAAKLVTVRGCDISDHAVRAAIHDAGYEAV